MFIFYIQSLNLEETITVSTHAKNGVTYLRTLGLQLLNFWLWVQNLISAIFMIH